MSWTHLLNSSYRRGGGREERAVVEVGLLIEESLFRDSRQFLLFYILKTMPQSTL